MRNKKEYKKLYKKWKQGKLGMVMRIKTNTFCDNKGLGSCKDCSCKDKLNYGYK